MSKNVKPRPCCALNDYRTFFYYNLYMFIRTTSEKIVLALLVAFLLVTIAKDWFDFYSCGGAVGQCISDAGMMQLYTKSCTVIRRDMHDLV